MLISWAPPKRRSTPNEPALPSRAQFYDGGLTIAKSIRQPETCITAMLILLASSFGLGDDRLDPTVQWLCDQQLADGGWNCESIRSGSLHGSFNTSISALDALLQYQQSGGGLEVSDNMDRGRTFFLDHRLYRSHRTGELVSPAFPDSPFHPNGISTCSAASSTSARPALLQTLDWAMLSRSSVEHDVQMGPGQYTGHTPARHGFGWNRPDPVVGRPCAPFGSSSGGTRTG